MVRYTAFEFKEYDQVQIDTVEISVCITMRRLVSRLPLFMQIYIVPSAAKRDGKLKIDGEL